MPRRRKETEAAGDTLVIPVVEERVRVGKRTVETGRVRVKKTVLTDPVRYEEDLLSEEVDVERVPVDRWVSERPAPYADGDAWVVPVVEEVLVVEKRLRVREELRIRRRVRTRREVVEAERRIEEVQVERVGPADTPGGPASGPRGCRHS